MLKPEVSLPVSLALGTMVYAIHSNATPPLIDIRAHAANDAHVDAARKTATWSSAAIVSFVSLVTKDPNIFIIGGGMVVLMDFWTRHANAVRPDVGKVSVRESLISQGVDTGAYTVDDTMPEFYPASEVLV